MIILPGKSLRKTKPNESLQAELRFARQMVRHIKSNAIGVCRDQSLVGAGAGQMSRVDSVEIAIRKAGERAQELFCRPMLSSHFQTQFRLRQKQVLPQLFSRGARVETSQLLKPVMNMGSP